MSDIKCSFSVSKNQSEIDSNTENKVQTVEKQSEHQFDVSDFNLCSSEDYIRRFHKLDELKDGTSDAGNGLIGSDTCVPDTSKNKILLEENSPKRRKLDNKHIENSEYYDERDKIWLIEKGQNHLEILPEGWVQVTHYSGMPLYLHKGSRVCTLAKPYFLGEGSARKHEIPTSAIPCLNYRRALEEETKARNLEVTNVGGVPVPTARIETIQENIKTHLLTPDQVNDYCKKLFKFNTIATRYFKSWGHRRQYMKLKKIEDKQQSSTFLNNTNLMTVTIPNTAAESSSNSSTKKSWSMIVDGKSYLSIFHEYLQRTVKTKPTFKLDESGKPDAPYMATIYIGDIQYCSGRGSSKKLAKSEAAKATLEILIPEMRSKLKPDEKSDRSTTRKMQNQDLTFFDQMKVDDQRVVEYCEKMLESSPFDMLQTCLQRNFGLGDMDFKYQCKQISNFKNECTITAGKHTVTVITRNKRDGKQRASQALLQQLHPHITSWGSLYRLYGHGSIKTPKEKKYEEKEITQLQHKKVMQEPNYAILNKLKSEMRKLKKSRDTMKGTFIPPTNVDSAACSTSNLKNINCD